MEEGQALLPPVPSALLDGKVMGLLHKQGDNHVRGKEQEGQQWQGQQGQPQKQGQQRQRQQGQGQQGQEQRLPKGSVVLRGAVFDWAQPLGHTPLGGALPAAASSNADKAGGAQDAQTGTENGHPAPTVQGVTLYGPRLELKPGELVGICGEVRCWFDCACGRSVFVSFLPQYIICYCALLRL